MTVFTPLEKTTLAASGSATMLNSAYFVALPAWTPPPIIVMQAMAFAISGAFSSASATSVRGPSERISSFPVYFRAISMMKSAPFLSDGFPSA